MDSRCIAVAWSGGRDSTALLHATLAAAGPAGARVHALHVHHGLSARADEWVAFCEAQASRWSRRGLPVELHVERLKGQPRQGQSVEAWARDARYEALGRMARAQGASLVLLAHHRRDQAETVLLQALRGAGVAGLSGMPVQVERDGIRWCRPWLSRSDAEIATYVRHHRLKHVEDDSNADPRLARNRLRLQVWPALIDAFDGAEAALADSATWAQQATACLAELAQIDLATVRERQGLRLAPLFELSAARRGNALRHWLREQLGAAPPASLLQRLGEELRPRGSARWSVEGRELRSHRGRLRLEAIAPAPAATPAAVPEPRLRIERTGDYALPGWRGELRVRATKEGGVPLAWLAALDLRPRSGAERFQAGIDRPPRSLKKQFQAAGIPAWQRDGPLLFSGGQLVFVPGLGLDARVIGLPGQRLVTLEWHPAV